MRPHTNDPMCGGCADRLGGVRAWLRDWFWNFVKPKFPTAHVSWGFRGETDQNAAFASGASTFKWPLSRHNRMVQVAENGKKVWKPEADAIDMFEQTPQGEYRANLDMLHMIATLAEIAKLPIRWGGKFRALGDFGHFEYVPPQVDAKKAPNLTPSARAVA